MTKRIKVTSARNRAIRSTSRAARSIDRKSVASDLGAEPTNLELDSTASPHALQSLRRALFAALRSSGGRPGLQGAQRRQKIPMMDADWSELEEIARSLQASGLNATAGQVAGQLLHDAVARFKTTPARYQLPPSPPNLRVSEASQVGITPREPAPSASPSETTYLVGAGINRGVQGPEHRPLPVARDFFQYVLEDPRFAYDHTRKILRPLWDFINRYWHRNEQSLRTGAFELEECFTVLELQRLEALERADLGRLQEMSNLEFLLVQLLTACFAPVEHWNHSSAEYQELGKRIYREKAAVVTFNYDTLLEAAIEQASPRMVGGGRLVVRGDIYSSREWHRLLAYKVHFDEVASSPGPPDPVRAEDYYASLCDREAKQPPFLKLHGSVDWHFHSGYKIHGGTVDIEAKQSAQRSRFQRAHGKLNSLVIDSDLELLLPLMITPVLNKAVNAHPVFRKVWQEALDVLRRTKTLVVAGYSFPPTDFHVRGMLREAFAENELEQLCVVNPDTTIVSVVRELCNFTRPVLVCRDIGEYLRRIDLSDAAR